MPHMIILPHWKRSVGNVQMAVEGLELTVRGLELKLCPKLQFKSKQEARQVHGHNLHLVTEEFAESKLFYCFMRTQGKSRWIECASWQCWHGYELDKFRPNEA